MYLKKKGKKDQAGKQSFVSNQLSFFGKLLHKLAEVSSGPEAWNRIIIPGKKKKVSKQFAGRMSKTQINYSLLPYTYSFHQSA